MLSKIAKILKNPGHVIDYMYHRRQHYLEVREREQLKIVNPFEEQEDGFLKRRYQSYDEYLNHQKRRPKPTDDDMSLRYPGRVNFFIEEFSTVIDSQKDHAKSVLCLGARDGAEVAAFRHYGMLAVGMDISFQNQNQYVHYGDFHDIPYPDNIFDYVYTNTLNHSLKPERGIEEARRVLKLEVGILIIDLRYGIDENSLHQGRHHSVAWKTQDEIISVIEDIGFKQTYSEHLEKKPFCQYHFQRI